MNKLFSRSFMISNTSDLARYNKQFLSVSYVLIVFYCITFCRYETCQQNISLIFITLNKLIGISLLCRRIFHIVCSTRIILVLIPYRKIFRSVLCHDTRQLNFGNYNQIVFFCSNSYHLVS